VVDKSCPNYYVPIKQRIQTDFYDEHILHMHAVNKQRMQRAEVGDG